MAKVLVCDDAAFMRQTLIQLFRGTEFEVVAEAENGLHCIEQYEKYKPDLVLMDITMPELDGIEAAKRIVQADPNAKIVMVSAMGQQDKVFSAIMAGAKDFIVKPFETDKIFSCLRKYI